MIQCRNCGAENFEDFGRLTATDSKRLSEIAEKFCRERKMEPTPINIVKTLSELGCIGRKQARSLHTDN